MVIYISHVEIYMKICLNMLNIGINIHENMQKYTWKQVEICGKYVEISRNIHENMQKYA